MSERVFKQIDLRYLANALGQNQTHAGISTFELGLGLNTEGTGSKAERAKSVLRDVFSRPNADELIVQLLNFVYVEDAYSITSSANTVYATLKSNVLDPRGVTLTEDGFILPGHFKHDDSRPKSEQAADIATVRVASAQTQQATPEPILEPQPQPSKDIDARKVFVVHGRDQRAVDVIEQFLQHIGLEMMAWSEARERTGKPQPHTYDIVKAGMTSCAAVIVLFSPDDLARAKDEFTEEGDPDRKPQGQARQNVLLEAGMAFAMAPDRTVFVQSARTREISDIAGFNWVSLDGQWDSRKDLKARLTQAGATIRAGDYDLRARLAGPFQVIDE
jgi:predicted nucleotide-binding protein